MNDTNDTTRATTLNEEEGATLLSEEFGLDDTSKTGECCVQSTGGRAEL